VRRNCNLNDPAFSDALVANFRDLVEARR